jgi:hypothetical protein
MLLTAVLIALGTAAIIFSSISSTSVSTANRQAHDTATEMARVKEALIGWSASRTPTPMNPNIRPGELPCPDATNSGNDPGPTCTAGAIGRVPWRSLGIPEPKDSSGETLWYAVSGPFRHYNAPGSPPNTAPITSDIVGTLTVHNNTGSTSATATTVTTQAIAVIFAPGAALGAQNRDASSTATCSTTGTVIARNLCASNYLDTAVGPSGNIVNATINGPFIQGPLQDPSSSLFNDRILAMTNADLMPVVEQRVAREMRSLLQGYRAATATSLLFLGGIYPWADVWNGDSNDGENRHRFPCGTATPVNWNSLVALSIPPTNTPALPNWLTNGCGSDAVGWSHVTYFSSGRNFLDILNLACSTCTAASLSVNGSPGFQLVLLTPGGASTSPRGVWPDAYFLDAENYDDNDDNYVTPAATAYNRARIYTIP